VTAPEDFPKICWVLPLVWWTWYGDGWVALSGGKGTAPGLRWFGFLSASEPNNQDFVRQERYLAVQCPGKCPFFNFCLPTLSLGLKASYPGGIQGRSYGCDLSGVRLVVVRAGSSSVSGAGTPRPSSTSILLSEQSWFSAISSCALLAAFLSPDLPEDDC